MVYQTGPSLFTGHFIDVTPMGLIPMVLWLVVWNMFYFCIYWVANHPLTDELILFRGVAQPPTSYPNGYPNGSWFEPQETATCRCRGPMTWPKPRRSVVLTCAKSLRRSSYGIHSRNLWKYICVCVCIHIYIYIIYTPCMYLCIYVYGYVYIYIGMYICI